jgi:hypothetical protein
VSSSASGLEWFLSKVACALDQCCSKSGAYLEAPHKVLEGCGLQGVCLCSGALVQHILDAAH